MENKLKAVLTNVIRYRLDDFALDQDYKLIVVKLINRKMQGEFRRLLVSNDAQAVTSLVQLKYLVLLNKSAVWPNTEGLEAIQIRFSTSENYGVYQNQILQLFLNQQTFKTHGVCKRSFTNGLFISQGDMHRCYKMDLNNGLRCE